MIISWHIGLQQALSEIYTLLSKQDNRTIHLNVSVSKQES